MFVEMPNSLAGPSHWSDRWAYARQPQMLVDLLGWHDLWSFRWASGLPLSEKIL
ncbi:MAG TPA: hypothetical protein VFT36_02240 [Methylomirabilota bacterium]|nr:hypothetical protein [Methylomirabilota bacterium]